MTCQSLSIFTALLVGSTGDLAAKDFDGSLSVNIDQRFFNDARFGNRNNFSEKFLPEVGVNVGLVQWPWGFQPTAGVQFVYNKAKACAVDANGNCVGSSSTSTDRLRYFLFTWSAGMRWRAYDPEVFWISPYAQTSINYRLARVDRLTSAVNVQKTNVGGDFGGEIEGGAIISFMWDEATRGDMRREWAAEDYGLSLHARYLPSGLFKHGIGLVKNTGGWSFGTGLVVEW